MKITKPQAPAMLEKIGPRELIDEAARTLPDSIDVSREQDLLARYRLARNQLIDRFGASPGQRAVRDLSVVDQHAIACRIGTRKSA